MTSRQGCDRRTPGAVRWGITKSNSNRPQMSHPRGDDKFIVGGDERWEEILLCFLLHTREGGEGSRFEMSASAPRSRPSAAAAAGFSQQNS